MVVDVLYLYQMECHRVDFRAQQPPAGNPIQLSRLEFDQKHHYVIFPASEMTFRLTLTTFIHNFFTLFPTFLKQITLKTDISRHYTPNAQGAAYETAS